MTTPVDRFLNYAMESCHFIAQEITYDQRFVISPPPTISNLDGIRDRLFREL